MNVEVLDTVRGRIAVHLICLGRSLWRGRFGSLSFFCAGIWRGFHDMWKGTWHPGVTPMVTGHHIRGIRW